MAINYRYLSFGVVIFIVAVIIFSLNISTEPSNTASVFTQTIQPNTPNSTTSTVIQNNIQPKTNVDSNQAQDPFNSNNLANTAVDEYNPNLPPGFPKPLPPLDQDQLRQTDELIAKGDSIVAEMDALIATLDLPEIQLSQAQQDQLEQQRQTQQIQVEIIKNQLEALRQDL